MSKTEINGISKFMEKKFKIGGVLINSKNSKIDRT